MEKLSLVIPCFNEKNAIEQTIDEVKFLLGDVLHELIIVDDGSNDGTYEILQKRNDIKLVRNPNNKGYGFSIKKGIVAATGEIIAITDADGTYPVEAILVMLKKLEDGYDLIIGKRENLKIFDPSIKKISRLLFKILAEFVAGEKILDVNSGLRVFRKKTILQYLVNTSSGFSFSLSTSLIFILEGKAVYYYPIQYKPRIGKSKVRYVRDILRSAQILIETATLYNPIKIFILISSLISFLGIAILVFSSFSDFIDSSIGFASFVLLQGMALFTFGLGLIAFLLKKRIFNEKQNT